MRADRFMAATMESLVELTRAGDVTVVHVRRTTLMDELTVQALHSHLTQGIEHGHYRKLVLNLTHLKFISSSALGMLVGIRMLAGERGGQLRVFGLNKMMQDLIDVSNLTSMLGVHDSEASALASLQVS